MLRIFRRVVTASELFFSTKKVKKYKSLNISACKRPTENLNPFLESLFRVLFSLDNGNFGIPLKKPNSGNCSLRTDVCV